MRLVDSDITLSASDLANFLGCRHRTALDVEVAHGHLRAPYREDPFLDMLRQRGLDHERAYADSLRAAGREVVDLSHLSDAEALAATIEHVRRGTSAILQAALRDGPFFGKPDVLLRVERPGPPVYEVVDTKLTTETRAGTILQLALYSELLAVLQGEMPERFMVVTPAANELYRLAAFAPYHRLVKERLRAFVASEAPSTYPEPVTACEVCRWWSLCDRRRRDDDHLSFVAGLGRLQRDELARNGVNTLAGLAGLPLPLTFKPSRGSAGVLERAREQARLQLRARETGKPVWELLPVEPGLGLAHLPGPSPGDLFLDLEGDPFARTGGREYLFGTSDTQGRYTGRWAVTDDEERAAFEATVDALIAALDADPAMHVYHYGAYEPGALKRLMGRYATRESEVDRLFRSQVLVDLHLVVRHALRAGVESYSLKALEALHGFTRDVDLREAGVHKRALEHALELGELDVLGPGVREAVQGYNRDDCVSTRALRDWLEARRAELVAAGTDVPRPAPPQEEPESIAEREARIGPLRARLLDGVPATDRDPGQQARYLLAHSLDFHRREEKVSWWEYFRLRELPDEELLDERDAISGLELVGPVPGRGRLPTHAYSYPPQDTDVREGDKLHVGELKLGTVVLQDRRNRIVHVKKTGEGQDVHPTSAFAFALIGASPKPEAIERLAADVDARGLDLPGAGRALLLRRPPRVSLELRPGESASERAVRIVPELDGDVLAIQGPPGTGKTYTGARMIARLVRQGRRVGVTAVSHKVIEKLLVEVLAADGSIACLQKTDDPGLVPATSDNDTALAAARAGTVVGGTSWLWSREEAAGALDVLFVDEAGQMALADVLAVSGAAGSLVLLGDPQQLEQPQKGSHPEGTDVSALEHVLGGRATIPEDRGIFLDLTRRLAPAICRFTSEVFYEGRLASHPPLAQQVLRGTPLDGAGLWVARVDHDGNQSASPEEAAAVRRIVDRLLPGSWLDEHGREHRLRGEDVKVVAPYNAQVSLLEEALDGTGVLVGTVDRFQGQEAPVVIYSMASSSPEDAPRGMEFLYSLNRLNVATSRARCACILVASPRLFAPECRSPRQMELASALCRYVELAKTVEIP